MPKITGPPQIGADPVLRHRSAGTWLAVDGRQPHGAHQLLHPFPAHHHPLPLRSGPLPIFLSTSSTGRTVSLPAGYTDWRVIDNDGCSRSTIPHRWARLMDRTSPPRGPAPPSAGRSLVQETGQRGVAPGLLVLTGAEDAGGTIGEGRLPSWNPAGVGLVRPASWAAVTSPFTASRATLALKAGLCFPRPLDISHTSSAATAAFSSGAGPSLSHCPVS